MAPQNDVCQCCKEERSKAKEAPRRLKRLPTGVTQDKVFDKVGLPVRLCEYCDGDALNAGLQAHELRTKR